MSRLHKVDPSTITSTPEFTIVSRTPEGEPYTVIRTRDNQTFTVGALVSNGTPMKGRITGFEVYMQEDTKQLCMFINHTWSGVGMDLNSIELLQMLPCQHQFGDPVICYFASDELLVQLGKYNPVPAKVSWNSRSGDSLEAIGVRGRIHAIHFLPSKIKYDIDMSFTGGANTRIYNVDSIFVFPFKD